MESDKKIISFEIPELNLWYKLSLRIIVLFFTAMLVSFTPNYFRDFLGDVKYPEGYWNQHYNHEMFDDVYQWGYRHALYFVMCVALFIVQAVRLGMWISHNEKNFKP